MDGMSAVSIFIGAGLGALLRWWLGLALNPLFPTVPMGTLAANALGGLLMGVLMAVFAQYETLPLALRLALTTGFLGGLTTFSTFSAETSSLLLRGEYGWAGAIVAAHVGASLLATLAGVMAVRGLLRWLAGAAA